MDKVLDRILDRVLDMILDYVLDRVLHRIWIGYRNIYMALSILYGNPILEIDHTRVTFLVSDMAPKS